MGKLTKVGKAPLKAALEKNKNQKVTSARQGGDDDGITKASPSMEQLSRGQRKRLAKREQYLKREKMIMSSLRLKRKEEQKRRIDGLDALREALPPGEIRKDAVDKTASHGKEPLHIANNKQKQAVAVREVSHLNLVLQHPSFKTNPFATIQEHLRNTLADSAKQNEDEYEKRKKKDEAVALKKKAAKKERLAEHKLASKGRKIRTKSRNRR